MNESRLRTIEQLQEFLDATPQVHFSAHGGDGDGQRYEHISAVLRRFDYLHLYLNSAHSSYCVQLFQSDVAPRVQSNR